MPHVNKKPPAKKGNLVQKKTRPRMNCEGTGKTIKKKIYLKNRKISKHQSEIAACEQKINSDKTKFC